MKVNNKKIFDRLTLCGVGWRSNGVTVNLVGPLKCFDSETSPRIHYNEAVTVWDEINEKGEIVRSGTITKAGRVTELTGTFPAQDQKILPYGGYIFETVTERGRSHKVRQASPLETRFINNNF